MFLYALYMLVFVYLNKIGPQGMGEDLGGPSVLLYSETAPSVKPKTIMVKSKATHGS